MYAFPGAEVIQRRCELDVGISSNFRLMDNTCMGNTCQTTAEMTKMESIPELDVVGYVIQRDSSINDIE